MIAKHPPKGAMLVLTYFIIYVKKAALKRIGQSLLKRVRIMPRRDI
jgi:hypothetical protein